MSIESVQNSPTSVLVLAGGAAEKPLLKENQRDLGLDEEFWVQKKVS